MEKNTNRKVYESEKVKDYRELVKRTVSKYPNNIAYRYKKDHTVKEPEYIEKTYAELDEDIKYVSTALLNLGLEGKKIIIIGRNRYEWCVSYLATTTGKMIIAPLDKALPENEIETLVKRSGAEAVIFDDKYLEAVLWHELLHFIIPNHSKRFHEILSYHMPEYNVLIKEIYSKFIASWSKKWKRLNSIKSNTSS